MNKKKYSTKKDKEDWLNFTKNLGNVEDKERNLSKPNISSRQIIKLDLHGYSLAEANDKVRQFIIKSYEENSRKLLIVTGKGTRSKAYENPYKSKDISILKNSVPDYIKSNQEISNKILKISRADQKDGGDGAFYILLKNKFW